MTTFEPFEKNQRAYRYQHISADKKNNISSSTINRIRNNLPISTVTLNDLCDIYQCNVEDIIRYVPDNRNA